MRTLVHCTAYAETASLWQTRYRMWLDAMLAGGLDADQILLVDDGSPTLPGWPDLQLFSGDALGEGFTVGPRGRALMFHFRQHLGRLDQCDFPGWHRSYVFGVLYAEANGFDRVIHVESDAFLISDRARAFVGEVRDGWVAPWSEYYAMPEMAISAAAGDGLRRLAAFARQPYAMLAGKVHEVLMPFTAVDKSLRGERYGETAVPVPRNADYATQVSCRREASYYWWLPGRARKPPPRECLTLRFGEGGNGLAMLDGGWALPEANYHWMVGSESIMRIPALPGRGDGVLRMGLVPCVHPDFVTSQRLGVNVAGRMVREFDITGETVIGCDVPASLLRQQGTNLIRLIHPDAISPAAWEPDRKDPRRLSLSLEWLTFERW
jgi:hypothetical protein